MLVPPCSTMFYCAVLCVYYAVYVCPPPCRRWCLVKATCGRVQARMGRLTNPYQRWRPNQKPSDLACGTPYQTLPRVSRSCARGANTIGGFGLVRGPLTNRYHMINLAVCHYNIVLPCLTGRGVKYTHNDIRHTVLHPDSGPRGIRLIPQASTQEVIVIVIVVGDGGAEHRSIDPPTEPHNVPTRHAVAEVHTVDGYPRAEGPHPTL